MSERQPRRQSGPAGWLNEQLARIAPRLALARDVAAMQRRVLKQNMAHYEGAGRSSRGSDFRVNRTDAIEAVRADRARLSFISRDMLRNNPRAVRICQQIVNQVVGAGIQYGFDWEEENRYLTPKRRDQVTQLVRRHCNSTEFDADGNLTIFGIQSLAMRSTVADGEVLIRRRRRRASDGLALPFQVQVLEADFLDRRVDGTLPNGNRAVEGIEFNAIGRRVFYHLFPEHPGGRRGLSLTSRRVAAENVIHLFRADRPGQVRGVSWLAPVITLLHEINKYQDGQVKRQEIAALFAGVLQTGEAADEMESALDKLEAGTIMKLAEGESMEFNDPPSVEGYEPFMRVTDRVIAAAVGTTYEALTGDYSNVNYTSGRMGRMDVDPNVRDWQRNLMVARLCRGLEHWIAEGVEDVLDVPRRFWSMTWTPPTRPVVDPTKDHKADETAVRSGKKSRRQIIRESGEDPDELEREIKAERAWENANAIVFTTNAGKDAARLAYEETDGGDQDDED